MYDSVFFQQDDGVRCDAQPFPCKAEAFLRRGLDVDPGERDAERLRDVFLHLRDKRAQLRTLREHRAVEVRDGKARLADHAAFYGKMFRMLGSINQSLGRDVLTCVTIWGVSDVTPNAWNTYVWKLNSTFGGILTEQGEIKTAFDAMYDALKTE